MKYLIVAGSAQQAQQLARSMEWDCGDWCYLHRPEQVLGLDRHGVAAIWYGDWYRRITELDLQEVNDALRVRGIAQFKIEEMR